MVRISAEFESPDLAELAVKRVKESIKGVHSTNIIYNKISDKAMKLRSGSVYTIIPTAVTTHNYITAVMESPASENVIREPYRSQKTIACIFCDESSSANARSLLSALGGMNVSNPKA